MSVPPQARFEESFGLLPVCKKVNPGWEKSNPKIKGSGDGSRFFLERQLDLLVLADIDGYPAAVLEAPEQQLVGQRSPDRVLDEPGHGPRTHQRIEALLRQVLLQALGELRFDLFLRELLVELHQELIDHPHDDYVVERTERDDRDRMSTRLNSSHRCISYAVFCLKKKNILFDEP